MAGSTDPRMIPGTPERTAFLRLHESERLRIASIETGAWREHDAGQGAGVLLSRTRPTDSITGRASRVREGHSMNATKKRITYTTERDTGKPAPTPAIDHPSYKIGAGTRPACGRAVGGDLDIACILPVGHDEDCTDSDDED